MTVGVDNGTSVGKIVGNRVFVGAMIGRDGVKVFSRFVVDCVGKLLFACSQETIEITIIREITV